MPAVLRRVVLALAAVLLCAPLPATWSIILIDTRTGEIAVGCATCLTAFDLRAGVPVIWVGAGAACAQSFVDSSGQNRLLIRNQLQLGTDPAQILLLLQGQDPGHQTRQYGIVDLQGRAVGFSGTGAGAWAGHITGRIGDVVYAIQGNVLTGAPVVQAAELAVRTAPGDLADRLMAGMEAARSMGGDGRCSCTSGGPTGCGAPPASFQKSSHIAFAIVARPGDQNGAACNSSVGCATGSYFLNLNIAGQQASAPDPVFQLQTQFLDWRLQNLLRPDHFRSEVSLGSPTLPADSVTEVPLRIVLRDWRGAALPFGGAQVTASVAPGSAGAAAFGATIDHGDGSYTIPVRATAPGALRLRVGADDGLGRRDLGPDHAAVAVSDALWSSRPSLSVQQGGRVTFVLNGGATRAGRSYLLLASAAGTSPGIPLGPVVLPLNFDPVIGLCLDLALNGGLPGFAGVLDGQGRREVGLDLPPGVLGFLGPRDLHFAFGTLGPIDFASNPVRLGTLP